MRISRDRLITASLLAAALFLTDSPAFSATIAGTKCNKAGITKTISKIKYTCINKGNKLVWDKGQILKSVSKPKPVPSPSQSETYAAEPTETQTIAHDPSLESSTSIIYVLNVTPGAFCSPEGAKGKSAKNVEYTCKTSATDTRNRWRQ